MEKVKNYVETVLMEHNERAHTPPLPAVMYVSLVNQDMPDVMRQYVDISLHYISRLLHRCYLMLTYFRRFVKEKYGNFTISSVCIKNRNYPLTKWRKCGRITMYIKAHKPLSRRSRVCRCAPESRAMVRARCVCIHEWTCEGKLKRAVRVRVRCGQHG